MDNTCNIFCNGKKEDCGYKVSCFQKIAGTLTGEEMQMHGLIIPQGSKYTPEYQTTTVDLSVGDGHYIYDGQSTDTDKKWRLVFIGDEKRLDELNKKFLSADKYTRPKTDKGQTLSIPPYGSALIQLNEEIDTYSVANDPEKRLLIVGRFDLKLSAVHEGLISQQATQIEPCYKGKLFCFIHNLSNKNIDLNYGDRIATIEFSYVSCFCDTEKKVELINELMEKNKEKYNKSYCNGTGIDDIRYFYNTNKLPKDCGLLSLKKDVSDYALSDDYLTKIAKKVEKKVGFKTEIAKLIITAILAILTAFFTQKFSNDALIKKIEECDKKTQQIENTNKEIFTDIKELENKISTQE